MKDLPNKGLTQEKTVAHFTLVLDDNKALKAHKRKDSSEKMEILNIVNYLHHEQIGLKQKYETLLNVVCQIIEALNKEEFKLKNKSNGANSSIVVFAKKALLTPSSILQRTAKNIVLLDPVWRAKDVSKDIHINANIG